MIRHIFLTRVGTSGRSPVGAFVSNLRLGIVRLATLKSVAFTFACAWAVGGYYLLGFLTDTIIPRVVIAAVLFVVFLAIHMGVSSWSDHGRD